MRGTHWLAILVGFVAGTFLGPMLLGMFRRA